MTGLERIQAERQRAIHKEGYTPITDRIYKIGELYKAADCYERAAVKMLSAGSEGRATISAKGWPWEYQFWKPATADRNLEKAGQLYMAECERLDFLIGETYSPILRGHYQEQRTRAEDGLERCVKALDELGKVTG